MLNKQELVSYKEAIKLVEKVGGNVHCFDFQLIFDHSIFTIYSRILAKSASSSSRRQRKSSPTSLVCDSQKRVDVLKLVSQKIASNVTWLIDNNLPPLMEYNSTERNFIKLDNVFAVDFFCNCFLGIYSFKATISKSLGIYDVTNAALLETFFVPYIWCPNCSAPCSPCSSEQGKAVSIIVLGIHKNYLLIILTLL